jgi:hypothetical protein
LANLHFFSALIRRSSHHSKMLSRETPMNKSTRVLDALIAFVLFAICLLLYNATLTPGLSYASPDGNELTTIAATLGLAHPTGYPLFTWLGFLFARLPFGEVAHRTNLMSAVLGAGGVAFLYLIARQIELSRAIAAFTALLFGVSTTFWSQAVITEVYAPNVFMLALTVFLLLQWSFHPSSVILLTLFALAFGLSLGTHMSDLGFAPAFAIFVLLSDWRILKRPLTLLAAFIAFLIGLAQFVWIPLKAASVNDPLILRIPLNTLVGMYVYTLGAFSNLRFAFPISAMPDRVMIYGGYLLQNLTPIGVPLGIFGMWALLFRHPKRFWLFILMYFVNVFFFTQYKAFDLDVFFIPAHFVFAIFVGVGAQQLLDWLRATLAQWRASPRAMTIAAAMAIIVFLYIPVAAIAATSARDNNRTADTAIGDFYKNVYAILPRDSLLVSRRGVFGYDAYYWQRVNHVRPDVLAPMFGDTRVPAPVAPLFTTAQIVNGQPQSGTWAPPPGVLPEDAWYIPILVGNQRDLVLYRASQTPPDLIVLNVQPQTRVERAFDGLTLLGYDLADVNEAPSLRVHLKMYWRIAQPRAYLIATQIDDVTLETHDLGFGNLQRYARAGHAPRDGSIVEEYDLVIPSYLKKGEHTFGIGLAQFTATGVTMQWVDAGTVRLR